MAKKTNKRYFPHDYHARHDPKLEQLMFEMGCEGIGIYWCLIEILYEQDGSLKISDLPLYARMLNTTEEKLNHTLAIPKLFKKNSTHIYSLSQQKRMKNIKERSEKARESALLKWDANAMRTQCEGNAINKRKLNKLKERKEPSKAITSPVVIKEEKDSVKVGVQGEGKVKEISLSKFQESQSQVKTTTGPKVLTENDIEAVTAMVESRGRDSASRYFLDSGYAPESISQIMSKIMVKP